MLLILYNSSINKKLILIGLRFRHHIEYFCSIPLTKMDPNTVRALFCISEQHDSVSFLNESTVLMIWFNHNDSLIKSNILPLAGSFNSTFKVPIFFFFLIISDISTQRFRIQISKYDLCIGNWRLNRFLSCIKQCVNTSKYLLKYIFCVSSALQR